MSYQIVEISPEGRCECGLLIDDFGTDTSMEYGTCMVCGHGMAFKKKASTVKPVMPPAPQSGGCRGGNMGAK